MVIKIQSVFEALSDPTRRQILELLKTQELSVHEIGRHFNISGASLSHHLNKLKNVDLVLCRRKGQKIFYSIHTSVFEDAAQAIANIFQIGGKDA